MYGLQLYISELFSDIFLNISMLKSRSTSCCLEIHYRTSENSTIFATVLCKVHFFVLLRILYYCPHVVSFTSALASGCIYYFKMSSVMNLRGTFISSGYSLIDLCQMNFYCHKLQFNKYKIIQSTNSKKYFMEKCTII